jgi:SAM-dependent methyltransferase
VGCGKGGFLKLLYKYGVKRIKGFDPSYIASDSLIDKLVTRDYFNVKNVKDKFDFIICRHVLEHIHNPRKFISSVKECLANEGIMYFELPSLEWIVQNKAFFDFFHEHCNYFTKKSLILLFNQLGFKNIIFNYGLGGQYYQLEISRFSKKKKFNMLNLRFSDFDQISKFINEEVDIYKKMISKLSNFAIWGAGAKGVTFLNRLNISRRKCPYVIDINPNKQNKFIPITGQKIISPKILEENKIKIIIIMNPIYEQEIKNISRRYNYKGKFILL